MACKHCAGGCVTRSNITKTGDTGCHSFIQSAVAVEHLNILPISESKGVLGKALKLGGQFQYADRPNANGRIYPRNILESAIKEIQADIKARRILGECDHPSDAKIHLDRISHVITELKMDGPAVYGELEIIKKTPMGAIVEALVDSKVSLGISSRGVGDMESVIKEGNEYQQVLEGYLIITFDVVAEPSVHDSYLSIKENRDRLLKQVQKNAPKNIREETEHRLIEIFKAHLLGRYYSE